eukprot:4577595-Amphidinium_carterae.1
MQSTAMANRCSSPVNSHTQQIRSFMNTRRQNQDNASQRLAAMIAILKLVKYAQRRCLIER